MKITQLIGYQILDSRGKPTVAAALMLSDGTVHTARIPSGASTGKHEAREIRDYETKFAEGMYTGNSVLQACANINELIAPDLVGITPDLSEVDQFIQKIDPTPGFQRIGANASLAVSVAVAKAHAHSEGKSLARLFQPTGQLKLPMPMTNILSGGAHARNTIDIQDVLAIPHGATSLHEAIAWISAIRECAARVGAQLGAPTHLTADEGGLAIDFPTVESACDFVTSCISTVGLKAGTDVSLAIDFAATQFYQDGIYRLSKAKREYQATEFVAYVRELVNSHPILSIEDPFAEDDWSSWNAFMTEIPEGLQVVGDDLYTTNLSRLERGIKANSSNAILIKPNQNGLLTTTLEVLRRAQQSNVKTIVSARSGETEDSWLADLAVGWGAEQIKVGSTHGSERTAKWNRLLELEAIEACDFAHPF